MLLSRNRQELHRELQPVDFIMKDLLSLMVARSQSCSSNHVGRTHGATGRRCWQHVNGCVDFGLYLTPAISMPMLGDPALATERFAACMCMWGLG